MNSTARMQHRNVQTGTAEVIEFHFEASEVRTQLIEDQLWFVAKDIISLLGYAKSSNPARVTEHVPIQWKGVNPIHTPGGAQRVLMLSEQGLYFFLGRSDKPKALPIQMWVAGEVLPAIRKHGRYEDAAGLMGTLVGQTIGTDGFHCLAAVVDGKLRHLPALARRRARGHLWSQVHKAFSVVSAEHIPASQLDAARNFIAAYAIEGDWLPRESVEEPTAIALDLREADALYGVMSYLYYAMESASNMNIAAIAVALNSTPLTELGEYLREVSHDFKVLDERRAEIYAAYLLTTGREGGYARRIAQSA